MTDRYKECYVAFLDILGFKDIIETSGFDKVFEVFQTIADIGRFVLPLQKAVPRDGEITSECREIDYNKALKAVSIYTMSDSIVVASPAERSYSLDVLIDVIIFVQCLLYGLDDPILLRGAIAKGKYYVNGNVSFGKGMIDAYLYQERFSRYPRIIISRELVSEVTDKSYMKQQDWGEITERPGKLVEDEDNYFYVDCLKEYLGGKNRDSEECMKFRKKISRYLDGYYDEGIREKYRWLENDFIRVVDNTVRTVI